VQAAGLSLVLCFFNLIPVPPLDGSHIMRVTTGMSHETYANLARYGFVIIIVLLQIPPVRWALGAATYGTLDVLLRIFSVSDRRSPGKSLLPQRLEQHQRRAVRQIQRTRVRIEHRDRATSSRGAAPKAVWASPLSRGQIRCSHPSKISLRCKVLARRIPRTHSFDVAGTFSRNAFQFFQRCHVTCCQ
jgi:hypothetical protein